MTTLAYYAAGAAAGVVEGCLYIASQQLKWLLAMHTGVQAKASLEAALEESMQQLGAAQDEKQQAQAEAADLRCQLQGAAEEVAAAKGRAEQVESGRALLEAELSQLKGEQAQLALGLAASQQQLAQVLGLQQEKVANQAALKEVQHQKTLAECLVSQLKADKVEMAGNLSVITQAAAKAKQAAVDRESTLQAKFADAQASWSRKAAQMGNAVKALTADKAELVQKLAAEQAAHTQTKKNLSKLQQQGHELAAKARRNSADDAVPLVDRSSAVLVRSISARDNLQAESSQTSLQHQQHHTAAETTAAAAATTPLPPVAVVAAPQAAAAKVAAAKVPAAPTAAPAASTAVRSWATVTRAATPTATQPIATAAVALHKAPPAAPRLAPATPSVAPAGGSSTAQVNPATKKGRKGRNKANKAKELPILPTFRVQAVRGDGNCQFRAPIQAAYLAECGPGASPRDEEEVLLGAKQLRSDAIEKMRECREARMIGEALLHPDGLTLKTSSTKGAIDTVVYSWREYLATMQQDKTWGDDLELSKGIVPVMKRKIHIYRQVADEEQLRSNADTCDYPGYKRVIIHGEGCYTGSKPIYLLWHAGSDNQGSHYDVLVPPQWR
eukprot:jgi/Chrzof1/7516/Cz02g26190.t1